MQRTAVTALVISVSLLVLLGLVMLYSTTSATRGEYYLIRQSVFLGMGLTFALIIRRFDYRLPDRWLYVLLGTVGAMLAYLATIHVLYRLKVPAELLGKLPFIGDITKGAYRWLKFPGGINFHPSELAKLVLIMFVARYFQKNHRYADTFKRGLLKPLLVIVPTVAAIVLSGSVSLTLITCAVITCMTFVAGVRLRWFIFAVAAGIGLIALAVKISPERLSRIEVWKDPEAFRSGDGYQPFHSQIALGSGGWHGVGFNESRMKEQYLPEAHTDFIMAIVGEELGFGVVALIMGLYLTLIGSCFAIAARAPDREGMLLAFGIGCSLGMQAFINLSVVSGFLPTTGITAPLISYGGSSMIVTWMSIGVLGSIARLSADNETAQHPLKRNRRETTPAIG